MHPSERFKQTRSTSPFVKLEESDKHSRYVFEILGAKLSVEQEYRNSKLVFSCFKFSRSHCVRSPEAISGHVTVHSVPILLTIGTSILKNKFLSGYASRKCRYDEPLGPEGETKFVRCNDRSFEQKAPMPLAPAVLHSFKDVNGGTEIACQVTRSCSHNRRIINDRKWRKFAEPSGFESEIT